MRYKADEILKHPWVSRHHDNPVPVSPLMKKSRQIECYHKLAKVWIVFVMSIFRPSACV